MKMYSVCYRIMPVSGTDNLRTEMKTQFVADCGTRLKKSF